MKKIFKLEGLECANCAAKMQESIGRLNGVESATVNFMTSKLVIEAADEQMEAVVAAARGIIKKLEPDVIMSKA